MGRIDAAFRSLHSRRVTGLLPYLMVGYPSLNATAELLYAIVQAGADAVELGVPFSDPLADGATLQRANQSALERGTTLRHALDLVASVRNRIDIPLVLMSYYNPLLKMGLFRLVEEAREAGVDGLIVPDLPLEEGADLRAQADRAGIDLIGMVAPTTPPDRIAAIAHEACGFVYCVSLKGVTGARSELSPAAGDLVRRVRAATSLPAVVGFGISSPEQVRSVSTFADGVVVASALLDRIAESREDPIGAAARFVGELGTACRTLN